MLNENFYNFKILFSLIPTFKTTFKKHTKNELYRFNLELNNNDKNENDNNDINFSENNPKKKDFAEVMV